MLGGLVVGGAEVAKRRVPATRVVETLEIGEDGVGRLVARPPVAGKIRSTLIPTLRADRCPSRQSPVITAELRDLP